MPNGVLDGFGDGTPETPIRFGEIGQNLSSNFGRIRRRWRHARTIGAHDFATERLLFIAHFDHEDDAIEPEIGACHRQRRAPLTSARFGRHAFETLVFGIIRLRNRRIELVRTRCIVSLEFVIDVRRRAELLSRQ